MNQLDIAKSFLRVLEGCAGPDQVEPYLHPEAVQIEQPNRIFPNGARRDRAAILEGALKGSKVMSEQKYEVLKTVGEGDTLAMEVDWSGKLAVAYGTLPIGYVMRAHLAMFLRFQDGRIVSVRNYDCYEPLN